MGLLNWLEKKMYGGNTEAANNLLLGTFRSLSSKIQLNLVRLYASAQ